MAKLGKPFGKTFSLFKVHKSIYHQKNSFISFLFHENILFTFEVIALLVTAYIIHRQIFGHFCVL